jgi:hypothetical protein
MPASTPHRGLGSAIDSGGQIAADAFVGMANIVLTVRVAFPGRRNGPAFGGGCKMDDVQAAKAPIHLWIVGFLSLIWNGFGCYDYLMTRMRNEDYFRSMDIDPQAMLAWTDGFPLYAQFGWGLGVWLALAGSILLLMRHRWAVPALVLSFLGAIISLGYQIFLAPPPPPPMNEGAMAMMPWVLIVIAGALAYYAHRQQKAGVLR